MIGVRSDRTSNERIRGLVGVETEADEVINESEMRWV